LIVAALFDGLIGFSDIIRWRDARGRPPAVTRGERT